MRIFTLSIAMIILLATSLSAQNTHFCLTDELLHQLYDEHPELIEAENQYEKSIQHQILANQTKSGDELMIIPVVFHILHEYGAENITDEQVYDAMNIINRDNRKLNPDTSQTIPVFQNIAAKTNIEFRLANIAPDGSCTNGINRIATYLTNDGSEYAVKHGQWTPNRYLNVWVVKNMDSGTAGFSFYPSAVNSNATNGLDGIVLRHNYTGSLGTASVDRARTFTHEAGHYLNLQHTWGNTNDPGVACDDDGVLDTPITKGWTTCPNPSQAAVCNADVIENYQNYMDYSYCSTMFTQGQADRMRAALSLNVAARNYLVSEQNNIFTGVSGEPTLCQPIVDFFTDKNAIYSCVGEQINFNALITNGTADDFSWSFPTANIEVSNEENPTVTYTTGGWKTVTLTAGNASGSGTTTKEQSVYVYGESSISANQFNETFESEEETNQKWIVGNTNNNDFSNGVNWAWSPVGCLEPGSMKLNIFDNPTPESYRFLSPMFDLTGKEGQYLSFKYAFATQEGSPLNIGTKLTVRSSKNCGTSEPTLLVIDEPADILTAGNYTDIDFAPTEVGSWKTVVIEISQANATDNVQFIFEVNSDFGENNFYIDDVNIGSQVVSAEFEDVVHNLKLFPNPATDGVQLEFMLTNAAELEVSIVDLSGKMIKTFTPANYASGENTIHLNTSDLTNGAYIIQLHGSESSKFMKLLIAK